MLLLKICLTRSTYAKVSLSLWLLNLWGTLKGKGTRRNKNPNSSGYTSRLREIHLFPHSALCSATCSKYHLKFCSEICLDWPCRLLKLEYKLNHLHGEDKFHSNPVKAPTRQQTWYPALEKSGCLSNWILLMAWAKINSQKSLSICRKGTSMMSLLEGEQARPWPGTPATQGWAAPCGHRSCSTSASLLTKKLAIRTINQEQPSKLHHFKR